MRPLIIAALLFAAVPAYAGDRGAREYERGMDAHHDESYVEAAAHWKRAYEAGFRRGASAYNVACAYAQLGEADAAFEWLGRAQAEGFDLQSYLDHDDDFDNIRRDRRFIELRRQAREERVKRRSHRGDAAAEDYSDLEKRGNDDPRSYERSGRELLADGKYDLAARAFVKQAGLDDKKGTAWYNAACAYSLAGDKRAALDALQRAIEEGYDGADHMQRDGDLDNIRGEARYRELHELAQELSMPMGMGEKWGLGRRMWQVGVDHFAKLAEKYPKMARIQFSLGFAQLQADHPEDAARSFAKAAEMGYRPGTSYYNLACSQARAGQKDRALDSLRKAMDAGFRDANLMRHDDDLESLHGDSRFRELIRKARDDEARADHRHFRGFSFKRDWHNDDDDDD